MENIKEKPILFSSQMIKAILNGNKSQTRRIVKFPKDFDGQEVYPNGQFGCKYSVADGRLQRLYPKYLKDDILYVKETFCKLRPQMLPGDDLPDWCDYDYKSTCDIKHKWISPIYMPKEGSRIKLLITNVKCQKLQDITEEDCIKEGIGSGFQINSGFPDYQHIDKYGVCNLTQDTAKMSYATLWDKINGNGSWDKNNWVFVYEFEKI